MNILEFGIIALILLITITLVNDWERNDMNAFCKKEGYNYVVMCDTITGKLPCVLRDNILCCGNHNCEEFPYIIARGINTSVTT